MGTRAAPRMTASSSARERSGPATAPVRHRWSSNRRSQFGVTSGWSAAEIPGGTARTSTSSMTAQRMSAEAIPPRPGFLVFTLPRTATSCSGSSSSPRSRCSWTASSPAVLRAGHPRRATERPVATTVSSVMRSLAVPLFSQLFLFLDAATETLYTFLRDGVSI
jgi:hypothetical protein